MTRDDGGIRLDLAGSSRMARRRSTGAHARDPLARASCGNERTAEKVTPAVSRMGNMSMADDPEIGWHREQVAKNRAVLEELQAGNTAGGDVFPETQSEIDHLEAQIAQSELIIAAYEKDHPAAS